MTKRHTIQKLAAEQGNRCAYCGVPLALHGVDEKPKWPAKAASRRSWKFRAATRDHITPKCEGGTDAWENLIAACFWCNVYRGNQPAEVAFARVQRQLRRGSHPHQVLEKTGWWPKGRSGLPTIHGAGQ